jgi:hypothetical protein
MSTFVLGAAGDESMKSARIGGFAVLLAVAAGVGPTAITPNAQAERGENVFQGGR